MTKRKSPPPLSPAHQIPLEIVTGEIDRTCGACAAEAEMADPTGAIELYRELRGRRVPMRALPCGHVSISNEYLNARDRMRIRAAQRDRQLWLFVMGAQMRDAEAY